MNRTPLAAIAIAASMLAGPGCESSTAPVPTKSFSAVDAGPNARFKGKEEEYKKMLDKNGRPLWKPGQAQPGRMPTGRER